MLIGYARVSTGDQSLALQIDAYWKKQDANGFFRTRLAGLSILDRISIRHLISLGLGDALVVWRLDRLSRSLRYLIETATLLESQGVAEKPARID